VIPRRSPRRLNAEERAAVLSTLNSERFADCLPAQVPAMSTITQFSPGVII
jgi:hypothetical protein